MGFLDFPKCCSCSTCSPSSSPRSAVLGSCRHVESFADGRFIPKGFKMHPVDLPSKFILDAMFEKVGLPSAVYSACAVHRGCLEITIAFHPIASELERPVDQTYISTSAFTDVEEAQNHVARKAMEFMEQEHNVVLGDYSYGKLQAAKFNNDALRQHLKEKGQSMGH